MRTLPGRQVIGVLLTVLVTTVLGAAGPAESAPPRHTIRVEPIGVTFELPGGFVALQRDVNEGGWGTIISFGKEVRPGQLVAAPLQVALWPTGFDG